MKRGITVKINNQREAVSLKGALVNSWQQFPATNRNDSNVQITCNPPNRGIVVSRLVYKKFVFDITINGVVAGAPAALLIPGFYGPRANPLLAVISSEQMTINNDTVTQAPISQYWPAIMRYHNKHDNRFGQGSLTPSMLDQSQNYPVAGSIQSGRNPLGVYGDNSFEQTRGSYVGMQVLTNPVGVGALVATIRLTVTEALHLSPFVADASSNFVSGFCGIQNMAYTATIGNIARVMSMSQQPVNSGGNSITINLQSAALPGVVAHLADASLLFEYLTPDPVEPLPRSLSTNYFSLVSYPTATTASIPAFNPLTPAASAVSITMQSVQVTSIPRRMYIFARRDDNVQTPFTTDTFLALNYLNNPLTVTWNNNQFFSQATAIKEIIIFSLSLLIKKRLASHFL